MRTSQFFNVLRLNRRQWLSATSKKFTTKKPVVTNFTVDFNDLYKEEKDQREVLLLNNDMDISIKKKNTNNEKLNSTNHLPPSIRQVRQLMDKYKDNVVLTQMGSFYELYFEHATQYAPKLNITLTSKSFASGKVPFAGFPVHQLNRHLKVLVNQYGYSVTIVDQFKKDLDINSNPTKFTRRVTRIVTPGTFVDEAFENFKENSYLLTIEFPDKCMERVVDSDIKIGISWCDISTGELYVQQLHLCELVSTITRIQPKEIVLKDELIPYKIESGNWYPELVELKKYFIKYQNPSSHYRPVSSFISLFASQNKKLSDNTRSQLRYIFENFEQKELAALRNLLVYVSDHFPNYSINFQLPNRQAVSSIMQIDSRTSRALELHSTVLNNNRKGSLLSTINRTITPVGSRLLKQWLSGPSTDIKEIKKRQNIVDLFSSNEALCDSIVQCFKDISDISRILQKFSFGKGNGIDLLRIVKSLKTLSIILEKLDQYKNCVTTKRNKAILEELVKNLRFDNTVVDDIYNSLSEEEILKSEKRQADDECYKGSIVDINDQSNDGNRYKYEMSIINPAFHPKLRLLFNNYWNLEQKKLELERKMKNFFGSSFEIKRISLKQRQSKDYVVQIVANSEQIQKLQEKISKNQDFRFNDSTFSVLQKSSQTLWLANKRWTELAYAIENAIINIKTEENAILLTFKNKLVSRSNEIRNINNTIGYLDILISFARLAREKNLVCPKVTNEVTLNIVNGRHIMVEDGLASKSLSNFVSNDCEINSSEVWIITGPNMGGKSTFLRQNAIIVILAQIGCFVPCDRAEIGIVDKIFSRVGSADDLYNDMSTFMVEMIETSFILRGATKRSLAILDEIGRGTSGKEGVRIAFATIKYMMEHNKCRTLFATHFGKEIKTILENSKDESYKLLALQIKYYQTSVLKLENNRFMYDYKLKPGICEKSDAFNVAKMAGFPYEVLQVVQNLEIEG